MDPDFLSAVNSCLLPKKSQFVFLEKNHGKSGFCGFKDQHFFHFFISPDTLRSEFFPPTLDGCFFFVCFFQVGSLFPILKGVHSSSWDL